MKRFLLSIIIICNLNMNYALGMVIDDVLLYVPFDEDVTARITRGNPQGIIKGEAKFVDGIKGKALLTGGTNPSVSFDMDKNISWERGALEMWVKPLWDGIDNPQVGICSSTKFGISGIANGMLRIYGETSDGVPFQIPVGVNQWKKGEWHHIIITYKEGIIEAYVDGLISSRQNDLHLPLSSFRWLTIGSSLPQETVIDEIYIYRHFLSAGEAKTAYQHAIQGKNGWYTPPSVLIPKITGTTHRKPRYPEIDGVISPGEWWADTISFTGYISEITGEWAKYQTTTYLSYDDENFYFAFATELANPEESDGLFEAYFSKGDDKIQRFSFNMPRKVSSTSDELFYETGISDGKWIGEVRLPLSIMGIKQINEDEGWRINFVRNFPSSHEKTLWSLGDLSKTDDFANVKFTPRTHGVHLHLDNEKLLKGEINGKITIVPREEALSRNRDVRPMWPHPMEEFRHTLQIKGSGTMEEEKKIEKWLTRNMGELWIPIKELNYKLDESVSRLVFRLEDLEEEGKTGRTYYDLVLPFAYSPPKAIVRNMLFEQKMLIDLDMGGIDEQEVTGHIQVNAKDTVKDLFKIQIPLFKNSKTFEVDIQKLKVGEYDLNIEIESQKGEKIREVTTSFSKITDLDWETVKNLGKEDIVPLPWHPVAISGNKVGVLGRDYYLGGLCLPEKIDVAGKNILASPVTLECIVNGNKVNLLKSPSKIISQRKSEVVFKNIEELSGLRIESQALIEFDGMMKIDLDLVPLGKTAKIERLKLIIPIKKDMANLLQYASSWDSARQSKQPSWKELWNCIELPDTLGEVWKSWFRFHLWVGGGKDSDTGISWFAESDENWVNKDNNNVQSIVNNKDSAIVEIVFIDSPVEIAKSIRFTFGLQATPVRPSINSRIYRAGSNVYEGGNLNASFDDFYGNGYSAFNPSGSTGLIALSNATGVFVAPYTVANYFPLVSMPGPYDFYKGCALSMGSPPFIESWKAIGHQLEYGLVPNLRSCIKSRFKDYFVWKMKYLFENYNPPLVYIDNMGVPQCNNILHGCGYEKGGRRYCTFPIFDLRDFLKRSRVVLTILGKKPPYFYVHSGYSLPPVHSFADIGLTGEQYNEILGERLTKGESLDYHDIMDWTMMKYEFRGGPCGLARIFLPEFTGSPPAPAKYFEENPGLLRDKTEGLVSIALLHDGNLWNAYCDNTVINRVWKALSDFGYFDAKFSPYWENNIFKPGNKETRVSYYRKDNTMLLVVSNPTESDINEIIEIDFANLGFKIKEAEDIYRSERFSLDGNRIPMTLAKRNFRLILIRGQ